MKKVISLLILIVPTLAFAQTYEYAAKYVCGKSGGEAPFNFAAGVYYTSINVHADRETPFEKTITVSLPDEKPGRITKPIKSGLPNDSSLQIDCANIYTHLKTENIPTPPGQPTEGFVIIRSKAELDVVGVYTAMGADSLVSTMHMDRVPVKRLQ